MSKLACPLILCRLCALGAAPFEAAQLVSDVHFALASVGQGKTQDLYVACILGESPTARLRSTIWRSEGCFTWVPTPVSYDPSICLLYVGVLGSMGQEALRAAQEAVQLYQEPCKSGPDLVRVERWGVDTGLSEIFGRS